MICHLLLCLLLSGQVELNPGPRPPKYPCGDCGKAVVYGKGKGSIACDTCDRWFHRECLNMNTVIFEAQANLSWHCCCCGLPNTSSIFDSSADTSQSSTEGSPGPPMSSSSPVNPPKQTFRQKKHTRRLKMKVINFDSLWAKKDQLEADLAENPIDIMMTCETHLAAGIHNSEILPQNYDAIRRDRNKDGRGGVAIIYRNDLKVKKIFESKKTELVAAEVQCQGKKPLIVAAVYRPPATGLPYMQELTSEIKELEKKYRSHAIWIGGDLNLPDINWEELEVTSSQYLREISTTFLDCLSECNLEQAVHFPTRGENTLELICTNRPGLVHKMLQTPGLSDHDTIPYAEIDCVAQVSRPVPRMVYLWNKADIASMRQEIYTKTQEYIQTFNITTPVEVLWSEFKNIIDTATNSFVPTKNISARYTQPWFTRACAHAIRQKKRAYRVAIRTKNPHDWARFNTLKKKAQKTCKLANINYISSTVNKDHELNSKRFYAYLKTKKTDSNGITQLEENGHVLQGSKDMANCLNRQFGSVFNKPTDTAPDLGPSSHQPMRDIIIEEEGVKKLLKQQKPGKAPGPDKIQARVLKEAADQLAPALTLLFNASYDQSVIPDDWRHAAVSPQYKAGKDNRSKAVNYRPISLTCLCCKVMEHIVCSNLMTHLDAQNILTDYQHGFRKKRSCESQLLITVDDLAKVLDKTKQADCILLDFSKAFDKVSHFLLGHKLDHYGVRGKNLAWIKDFLNKRTQSVVLKGETSDPIPVTSGVPQGSVLGPALFLVYINDLPDCVKSTPRLFADDCLLYRVIGSQRDADLLQLDLNALEEWEKKWQMEFAPDKCKLLRITRKTSRLTIHAKYYIRGEELETVSEAKYLGVTLDAKLNFNAHINKTVKKANSSLHFIQRNLRGCNPTVKASAYNTYVRPIAEYASAVWDPNTRNGDQVSQVEAIQRKAARFVCSDYRRDSSVSDMIQRLQWQDLQERRTRAKITILHRIINGQMAVPHSHLSTPSPYPTRNTTANKFRHMQARTHYASTFFPSATVLWGGLNRGMTLDSAAESFQSQLALVRFH